ncbi:undecaprenyl-phosphate glucose phosphotransferase [Caldicellulosiruptoraceae bacterium PP1]
MHNIKKLYINIIKLIDIIFAFLSFFIAWYIKFESNLFPKTGHLDISSYLLIIAIYIPFFLFLSSNTQQYLKKINIFQEIYLVLRANFFSIIFVVVFFYVVKQIDYSRIFLLIFVSINILFNIITRLLSGYLVQATNRVVKSENILFIGKNNLSKGLHKKFQTTSYKNYKIIGYIDDYKTDFDILGKTSDLEKIIKNNTVDEIIISIPLEEYHKLDKIIDICEKYGVRTYIIPDYLKYIPSKAQIEAIDDIPLINVRYSPLDEWTNRFIKRSFDIIVSLLGLIICLPIFLIIAIMIKLTSKGPIIFTQERVGYNRRIFKMHKFRTMKVQKPDEEKNKWTTKDDPRRTPIGKILRKLSLDELPQLWDVLIGNMSLVGPRPERPQFVEKFKEEIPKYMIKHRVRPGITGLAQVHGLRGDTSIEERIKYDIEYIENWTFSLDIKILFATIFKGKFMENAY